MSVSLTFEPMNFRMLSVSCAPGNEYYCDSFIEICVCIPNIGKKMPYGAHLTIRGLVLILTFDLLTSKNLISSSLSQLHLNCKFGEILTSGL